VPQLRVVITSARYRLHEALAQVVDPGADTVITTRVDSDDGIAVTFVEVVRSYASIARELPAAAVLLSFPRGFQIEEASGRVFEQWHPRSAFLTMVERCAEGRRLTTVYSAKHGLLPQQWPTHQDVSLVGWIQLIHGGNVLNRLTHDGVEVDRSALAGRFALADGRP
jgi:hypothetical protein